MNFKLLLIADPFSSAGYSWTSATTKHILPNTLKSEILNFKPNLLLVESAWQGLNSAWHRKLSPPSPEIIEYLDFCKIHSIPTVFWNKEDPVHFGTFIPLARHFDHVATTDIDCIPRYMKTLGHNRVFLLPFAAQPKLQSPLPTLTRSNGFSFAGSWYQRYPERQHDFANLVRAVSKLGPLDIFDRNYYNQNFETQFPAEYDQFIRGHLTFDQIDHAYKGYRFALNINTVKHSQSMFARRVFELMACNTLVVSNESRGMRIFFGDLVIASDDSNALENEIRSIWKDDVAYQKRCLLALRKILTEHTYEHRLEYLKARIKRQRWSIGRSEVLVLSSVENSESELKVIENFKRQASPCRLLLLRNYSTDRAIPADQRIDCLTQQASYRISVKNALYEVNWVSFFSPEDTYGAHYLTDLVLASSFSEADAFGKTTHYRAQYTEIVLKNENCQYLQAESLAARAALIRSSKLSNDLLESCLGDIQGAKILLPSMLGIDQFHYCREGSRLPVSQVLSHIGDLPLRDLGLSLANDILPIAERLTAKDYRMPTVDSTATQISATALHDWFSPPHPGPVTLTLENNDLHITSEVPEGEHLALRATSTFSLDELNLRSNNNFRLMLDHNFSEFSTIIEYLDLNKNSISHTTNEAGSAYSLILPDNCAYLRISLRLSGSGVARVHSFVFGKTYEQPAALLDRCTHASRSTEYSNPISHERTGASAMSLANRAQAAFDSGDYQLAVDLYERAIAEQPELAHTYNFGLIRARKQNKLKLSLSDLASIDTSIPSPTAAFKLDRPSDADTSLNDLYKTVANFKSGDRSPTQNASPLISILMTARNCADFIEESVTSALRQNWPNLEVIVIDDASTDSTWIILKRLMNSVENLKCRRTNSNLGPNFAKNYAIFLAKGTYVFFQDAKDICHPDRTRLMMSELEQPNVVAVRGASACLAVPSAKVSLPYGANSKFEIHTYGFNRRVFDEIGYFNYRHGEDEAFSLWLENWAYQNALIVSRLDLPLYFKTIEDESSHQNAVAPSSLIKDEGTLDSHPAKVADEMVGPYYSDGLEHPHGFFRFPCNYDLKREQSLVNPSLPVVISICSIPERSHLLPQVLASLAPQVDALHVYLDRYDSVPDSLLNCHDQVTVYLSKDHPGLRDNGKFLAFADLNYDCYYFTADDDIIYPPDYVASMVNRIEHYAKQAVIGVHGVLLPEQAEGYFSAYRKVHMFSKELERDALVNNLGTGTVAFHSSLLNGLNLSYFGTPGMADLHLSIFCKQRNIPMIALARPDNWLQELPSPNESLYNEFRKADEQQSALVNNHRPWGYAAITMAVVGTSEKSSNPQVGARLHRLIPKLHSCLK